MSENPVRLPGPDCFVGLHLWVCRCAGAVSFLSFVLLGMLLGQSSVFAQPEASSQPKLLQFVPGSAGGLAEAAQIAEQLHRSSDARQYLRTLLNAQPGQTELQQLRSRYGVGVFLQFNANPDLQPEARELLNAINQASRVFAASDARLRELAAKLGTDGSDAASMIVEILSAEDRAAVPLLELDQASAQGQVAQKVLEQHARSMRRGLLAAIPAAADDGRQRIIRLLATTADSRMALHLLRWRFADDVSADTQNVAEQAIERLWKAGGLVISRTHPPVNGSEAVAILHDQIRMDLENAAYQFPVTSVDGVAESPLSSEDRAALLLTARNHAEDAALIRSGDVVSEALLLICQLGTQPVAPCSVDPMDSDASLEVLTAALSESLQTRSVSASQQILQMLIGRADSDGLSNSADVLQAVKRATQSSDPRVRLVAGYLQIRGGLVALNPTTVKRSVESIENGSLMPEAVVIDPDADRLPGLAGVLSDCGYLPISVRTGSAGFDAAVSQMHCELILVRSHCLQWDLTATVANLRADARTAMCPIVVYGPKRDLQYVRRIAERYPGVWFMSEPFGHLTGAEASAMQMQLQGNTNGLSSNDMLTTKQRLQIAGVPQPQLMAADREALKRIAAEL